ncbi:CAP domain-containing protein [Sporomusa termitida]|uniref:CAP domain-containing protein n=1 Tax=Sporomusa termitida TaxID=2377 RepID=UPI001FE6D7F2|nr:CAP domain-containing protein [Sporomusa termitida]
MTSAYAAEAATEAIADGTAANKAAVNEVPANETLDTETTVEETLKENKTAKNILTGIVAIGLISALTNHGSKSSDKSNQGSTGTGNTGSSGSTSTSAADEQQALALLNQDRTENGLSTLKSNSQLTTLARTYAKDMIDRNYFSHYNPEGQSPFDRMTAAGISYKTAGENLAINSSVANAEKAFMNSSGHRANILNSAYTDVGVGVVRNASGQVYVVQEFISK